MKYPEIEEILLQNNGTISMSQIAEAGIAKSAFYGYAKNKALEQVAHGIYATEDSWPDYMYLLHLRCPKAIFSHEAALFLHDLTDNEPTQLSVTMKTGYNPTRLKAEGIKVYTVKSELHELGLTQKQTSFGNTVPVYNLERTICDIVRSRSNIEHQSLQTALKIYAKHQGKNLRQLMEYAEKFKVQKLLKQYLEVLL